MINNQLICDRSIRTVDIELFKHILPAFINLFFAFNYQNYDRFLTLYHVNVHKVEKTHPGLKVNIGIKRTKKTFSKRLVDFTVETTINADAAKHATFLRNSLPGCQR